MPRRGATQPTHRDCQSCYTHLAMTTRLGAPVCRGCAHMIDKHGAKLHDAYAADPCRADT